MSIDFSTEYSGRSDDELLQLASERHSLTTDAAAALDAELRRRNLSEADRIEHQRSVRRQQQREARKHRRKPFGPFKYQLSWRDIFSAFAAMALIVFAYLALPSRLHFLKPEWQDPAVMVIVTSVMIAVACKKIFLRNFMSWVSLLISTMHLFIVHALTQRGVKLNHGVAKGAGVVGFLLFLAIDGVLRFLKRMFNREEILTVQSGDKQVPITDIQSPFQH